MNTPFLDQPLAEFLGRVASDEPAPGGGAAAAVTAALAAGLVGMAARFSASRLPDSADRAARADVMRRQLADLAQHDATAYGSVLTALRLPREPDAQDRRRRIRAALEQAARIPLTIAELSADVAREAAALSERGNPNLRGDALTAVFLAEAAARAAAELVRINAEMGSLGDEMVVQADRALDIAAEASSRARAKAPPVAHG